MKKRYLFFEMFIRNGEYEYNSKSIHFTESDKPAQELGDEHASSFYIGEGEPDGDGFFFHAGSVYVECRRAEEITEAEYNVLTKFI